MHRCIEPADLRNNLGRQLSDVVILNDGATEGEYSLTFGPGGLQSGLPLFHWRKTRHAKRVTVRLCRHADSGWDRESPCEQTR